MGVVTWLCIIPGILVDISDNLRAMILLRTILHDVTATMRELY